VIHSRPWMETAVMMVMCLPRVVLLTVVLITAEPVTADIFHDDTNTVTLYRNSVIDINWRLHIATFDAAEGFDYNWGNCLIAKELFNAQRNVKTTFWCERGTFKE